MDVLLKALPFSEKIRGSEMLFDGFTGFTPIQMNVIRELLILTDKISVTVTMDAAENAFSPGKPYQLFYMSRKMIRSLSSLTKDLDEPVYVRQEKIPDLPRHRLCIFWSRIYSGIGRLFMIGNRKKSVFISQAVP